MDNLEVLKDAEALAEALSKMTEEDKKRRIEIGMAWLDGRDSVAKKDTENE